MAETGIGETLRAAREERGVAIEDVARSTRVRVDYLHALEAEEFDRMGGDVYAKGFLKTYAQALGLDPESLLAIYRRRVQGTSERLSGSLAAAPAAREPRGAPPMWIVWFAAAILVLIGIGAVASLVEGRSPEPAVQPRPPAAATPTPTPTPTEPTPTPTPTPTFDGVHVVLTFEMQSWVRVLVDGQNVREEVVDAGEELVFDGTERVVVRFGNAGGVRVSVNGEDYGIVGEPGRVETREYTQDGPTQDPT